MPESAPASLGRMIDLHRMIQRITLLCLAGLFVTTGSRAQESMPGPAPCTSIAESGLIDYVGTWEVDWSYRTSPGVYQESEAQSSIEAGVAECAIVETFRGILRGVTYEVLSTFVADKEGALNRSRLDSEHGAPVLTEGFVRNDSLVFEMRRQFGERVMRTRHVFSPVHDGQFSSHFYLSRSLDDPWTVVEESHYRMRR